jgi:hypothetical protein
MLTKEDFDQLAGLFAGAAAELAGRKTSPAGTMHDWDAAKVYRLLEIGRVFADAAKDKSRSSEGISTRSS